MTLLTAKSDKILRRLTGGTLIFVGIAGGIQSYTYLAELAITSGVSRSLAPLFPLSVDGLIIAGSLSLLRASLQQRRDFFAWSLVLLGSALSIWGNIVGSRASGGGLVANAVHTIPVIAMIAALEAFLSALRHGYVQKSEKVAADERALALQGVNHIEKNSVINEANTTLLKQQESPVMPATSEVTPKIKVEVPEVELYPVLGQRHRSSPEKIKEDVESQEVAPPVEVVTPERQKVPGRTASKPKTPVVPKSISQVKDALPTKNTTASEATRTKAYQQSVIGFKDESLTKQAAKVLEVHDNLFTGRINAVEVSEALAIPLPQARKAIERGRGYLRKVA